VPNPAARTQLRAELDDLIAHLYGLTETEFATSSPPSPSWTPA